MKVLVAGGATYENHNRVFTILNNLHGKDERISAVVGTLTKGLPTFAYIWAKANNIDYIGVPKTRSGWAGRIEAIRGVVSHAKPQDVALVFNETASTYHFVTALKKTKIEILEVEG